MKIKLIISFLFLILESFAINLPIYWDRSTAQQVTGYKIFLGTNSGQYDLVINVGNVTNYCLTNISNKIIYIAGAAYDAAGNESSLSEEISFTNSRTYLGMFIEYGTNISFLNRKSIMTTDLYAGTPNFYRAFLVMTNNPVIGLKPDDTNKYLYLVQKLQYGTNISYLTTKNYDLMNFTNPPSNQFYRGKLVITNQSF